MGVHSDLWKERLEIPAYRVGEAASYANISPQTVAAWEGHRSKASGAVSARPSGEGLTFLQLIEVGVVADLRREGVKLDRIRRARDYFARVLGVTYPFAREKFKTDGVNILLEFTDAGGNSLQDRLVVSDESGQLIWADFLQASFKEFNYLEGTVVRWHLAGANSEVVVDPRFCFGAPSVRGIKTAAIKNEWAIGSSIDEISEDFSIPTSSVTDALRFEKIFHLEASG